MNLRRIFAAVLFLVGVGVVGLSLALIATAPHVPPGSITREHAQYVTNGMFGILISCGLFALAGLFNPD